MLRPLEAVWHRFPTLLTGAAAVLALALSVWALVPGLRGHPAPDVLASMTPEQMPLLIVEAHDEWTGDPPRVPAPAMAPKFVASVASRNRNPLNMKYGALTRKYLEQGLASISRILPRDGGAFLKFQSATGGFRAALELLSSPLYSSLDVNKALRRWSHNGYGGEIVGGQIDPATSVSALERDDLKHLLGAMAAAEGYRSSQLPDEIASALANRR